MNKSAILLGVLSLLSLSIHAQDWAALAVSPLDIQIPGKPSFKFTFEKIGTTVVNPYTVSWQLDNGSIHSVLKTNITTKWYSNGTKGQVTDTAMSVALPAMGTYTFKAWINVTGDTNPANDTVTQTIHVYEAMPKKNVLLEVFKHEACGPCYDAAVFTDTLIAKNPDYAVASIYTVFADAGYNSAGAVVNSFYGFYHPGPVFDRFQLPFTDNLTGLFYQALGNKYALDGYGDRAQYYEPLQVSIKSVSYDKPTRQLKVKVAAKAWLDMTGDFRFNVYLTEDSVLGQQANAPDPNNYYHMHVLREMLGGAWGQQGSMPSTLTANQEVEYEFSYAMPRYDINNMKIIALVQTYNANKYERRILNSVQTTFNEALAVKDMEAGNKLQFSVYPNPTAGVLKMSLKNKPSQLLDVSVTDMSGKIQLSQQVNGDTELNISHLAPATYLLRVDDGQVVYTRSIVKE